MIQTILQHSPKVDVIDSAGYTPTQYIRRRPTMDASFLQQFAQDDDSTPSAVKQYVTQLVVSRFFYVHPPQLRFSYYSGLTYRLICRLAYLYDSQARGLHGKFVFVTFELLVCVVLTSAWQG